ncbi:hypothetical protein BpHYR1_045292 [Brachionus plicatilis]|uniref:Uncharacterized protein n=1 Tax=Brachionus plicatilis TaxID=10195 RepID=A0A3M7SMP6_BRAPC|nr:hypothetical protein BpHYR1_045292 [Brachionus plicatilis]
MMSPTKNQPKNIQTMFKHIIITYLKKVRFFFEWTQSFNMRFGLAQKRNKEINFGELTKI